MLFEYYRSGKTCLGKTIYLPETDHQNWARKAARGLGAQITWELEKLLIDESILDTTIEHLHRNLNNPIHYGTAKPGSHFESGVPVVPDPRFTYLDLMGFGISGEDGYKGFLRDCGLPKSVPYTAVVLATCFLLIDDAVEAMGRNDPWYATWALHQAHQLFGDVLRSQGEKSLLKKHLAGLREGPAAAGKANRERTEKNAIDIYEQHEKFTAKKDYRSLSPYDQAKKLAKWAVNNSTKHVNGRSISVLDIKKIIQAGKPKKHNQ